MVYTVNEFSGSLYQGRWSKGPAVKERVFFPAISVRVDGAKKKPGLEDGYISLRAYGELLFLQGSHRSVNNNL